MTRGSLRDQLRAWFALAVVAGVPAARAQFYVVTDMGTLPGGSESYAWAINRSGEAAGTCVAGDGTLHAFFWRADTMRDIAPGKAWGMNDKHQVVGDGGFIWDPANGLDQVPANVILASDINNAGEIVGYYHDGDPVSDRAFLYTPAGDFSDIGTAGGPQAWALAVNEAGHITGSSWSSGEHDNVILVIDGQLKDLGSYPGSLTCSGDAVNESDQIAGTYMTEGGDVRAFLCGPDGEFHDLGSLPGGSQSIAHGVNRYGQIVGQASVSSGDDHAFIWEPAQAMRDLNTLIAPESGWLLREAIAVNAAGQIAGSGTHNGHLRAFLLTPLVCTEFVRCDANCDGGVDFGDIDAFVLAMIDPDAYVAEHPLCNWLCNVDANRDGSVNFSDIDAFVQCMVGG